MSLDHFRGLIQELTRQIAGKPVDGTLEAFLTQAVPADGPQFAAIEAACRQGVAEGWMCQREQGGVRFGRVLKPEASLAGYSVDVVEMADIAGPHHRHPKGEIDMVMPITEGARFDGAPRGWKVYGPETAHRPTVSGGRSLVLYLLPDGEIDFTR